MDYGRPKAFSIEKILNSFRQTHPRKNSRQIWGISFSGDGLDFVRRLLGNNKNIWRYFSLQSPVYWTKLFILNVDWILLRLISNSLYNGLCLFAAAAQYIFRLGFYPQEKMQYTAWEDQRDIVLCVTWLLEKGEWGCPFCGRSLAVLSFPLGLSRDHQLEPKHIKTTGWLPTQRHFPKKVQSQQYIHLVNYP